ncbi:MAG TPA: TIGR01777 family oxidoreductase [Pyrinomonadaceae bacterium]|nr:TIGR01777 family oxidoreductase [Pyrinomonadaceae bacterium]
MKIIVTGATGLIGSALVPALIADGHNVTCLVRGDKPVLSHPGTTAARWNPEAGEIDKNALEGHDAAVHLAGESIAEGRWTDEKKRRIIESREKGTRLIAETLAALNPRPKVFVAASAIGYYGDRGAESLDESSSSGKDFVSEVCRRWEAAAEAARAASIRVVHLRIGMVLSGEGGALGKMLTPFKMGVGGKIGSGEQYMSWIALDDVVGTIKHALKDESLEGAVNTVAPGAVTNAEFTKTLGGVLGRPTLFPVPAFAARLAFGEMADELLLSSTRVEPKRLHATNYQFAYPQLEGALRHVLKK